MMKSSVYRRINRIISGGLMIALILCAVFSDVCSAGAFSSYYVGTDGLTVVSSDRSQIYNDAPNPEELRETRSPSSAVLQADRKELRHSFRTVDHLTDGGVSILGDPKGSQEKSVYYYHISIHPGDMIIRYIHDQDGEKDRVFL